MPESIFSTYRGGENRVAASIVAVLRSLTLSRIEVLLGGLLEQAEFELVRFKNQPKADFSVPDAEIACCWILIEAKIERGAMDSAQLTRHLQCFDQAPATSTQVLLLLTPDEAKPAAISRIADERLVWASFARLNQAIEDLFGDTAEVISERDQFLLRELQTMLVAEG